MSRPVPPYLQVTHLQAVERLVGQRVVSRVTRQVMTTTREPIPVGSKQALEAVLGDTSLSKSAVSRIVARLKKYFDDWSQRDLVGEHYLVVLATSDVSG